MPWPLDALEDLSEKIDVEFASERDVAAELHHRFNEVYAAAAGNEKDPERSERLNKRHIFQGLRALELRRQFYGERHELVAKDMYYASGSIARNEEERGKVLSEAIQMIRETNPNNLNFPYMLEEYTARLMWPGYEKSHKPYRDAVVPSTEENSYQIAERLLRESLTVFRHHYKEENLAIFGAECKLAYTLAMQDKWTDFDEHYQICKQGKPEFERQKSADREPIPTFLDRVERVLAEKGLAGRY